LKAANGLFFEANGGNEMTKAQLFGTTARRSRRLVVVGASFAILVAAVVVGLASAASAAPAKQAAGGNLNLWEWQAGTPYIQMFNDAGARYKAKDGGNVTVTDVPYADYFTKFKTAVAAGSVPDLLEMSWTGDYRDLIKAGALMPLDTALKTGFPKFYKPVMDSLTYKGHIYGIPMDLNTLTIAYNQGIFKKLGLKVPKTLAQLLALAAPIRKAGYQPLAVNAKDGWPDGDLWFAQVAYTDPTEQLIRKAELGAAKWNNPAFVTAATNVQKMVKSKLFADGSLSLDFNSNIALFGSGKAAMTYPVGNFDTPLIDKADGGKFRYDLFPFPPLKAGQKSMATGGPAIIFSIPAKSANPQGALNFIRMTVDPTGFKNLVANNYIPSAPADISSNKNRHYQEMVGFQATAQTRAIFVPSVYTQLLNSMQGLVAGQKTPAQVGADLKKAAG
jgi:raffinose/stachyose/melibiose transport system substrate-binding protein